MEIIFNKLFRLDLANKEFVQLTVPADKKDLKSYIQELLDKILVESDRKGFTFKSETTEVHTLIKQIISDTNADDAVYLKASQGIAKRLLEQEILSEQRNNFNVELQKGVVVITFLKHEDGQHKVIISKADYDGFLDGETYTNRAGFPLKKKIYKAFMADVDVNQKITRVSVYDNHSTFTVYWWRDFLELEEVYTDEHNTEQAFAAIESKILVPIKRKHKADYIALWNASVHYFRLKPEFSAENYITDILTGYQPFDPELNPVELADKAKKVFEKGKFDSKFKIVASQISKKFKKSIQLTPQIELNLKNDISNLESTIMRYQQANGDKWVMIKSEEGFQYFGDTNILP
jgi:hypothetical protein